jgi:hypothetical protein
LWFERQNLGASYSSHRAAHERHIVVCSTNLQYDIIFDFLHEFYAHRKNHVIIRSQSSYHHTAFVQRIEIPEFPQSKNFKNSGFLRILKFQHVLADISQHNFQASIFSQFVFILNHKITVDFTNFNSVKQRCNLEFL